MSKDLIPVGEFKAIPSRGLTEESCRKWGYTVSRMGSETVQVANYRDASGTIVAQKVRTKDKSFKFLGDTKAVGFYGQHMWNGGKMLVVTEGEIDAISVSQMQSHKWPVVSVPNGAQGAARTFKANLEWLDGFDTIVLMFDQDEPGRKAAEECAQILRPGKAKIASLPLKDANDCLKAGRGGEIVQAIWNAKPWRPDGIVKLSDIRERVRKEIVIGLPWFLPSLTEWTYGRRYGEIYTFGAGTGVGKTDLFTQQIEYDITVLKERVGVFFFEQEPEETARRIAGKRAKRRFHIPDGGWSQEEYIATVEALEGEDRLYLYDHFGCIEWDVVEQRIRYLAITEGIRIFYVDHLTALADPSAERESLETLMAALGSLVKELKVMVHLVSHLSTPDGKPHEEGGRVMIRHFKGSRSIGFWSHFMMGLERDQQAEDEVERKTTTLRCLKDRYTGNSTGKTIALSYDEETGMLSEGEACPFQVGEVVTIGGDDSSF